MADKRPIDMALLHRLEERARDLARQIDARINHGSLNDDGSLRRENGFCLMVFSFDGPEMTYISNAERADMIKAIEEFLGALKAGRDDELSRPKGRG